MEAEDQLIQFVEHALQYHDVKKCYASSMWSTLYQCASEKFPHIFLMTELCLSAPYSNQILEKFFSFMKVLKCDWRSKLSEENIETLLHIKVKAPKIEEFIKEDASDAAAFW